MKRIYHVFNSPINCVSMLRERLIHSLHYHEFVELTLFAVMNRCVTY